MNEFIKEECLKPTTYSSKSRKNTDVVIPHCAYYDAKNNKCILNVCVRNVGKKEQNGSK